MNSVEKLLSEYELLSSGDKAAVAFAVKQERSKTERNAQKFSESLVLPIIEALNDFETLIARVPEDLFIRQQGVHKISIGEHIAHVLDIFRFVLDRSNENYIDLAEARKEIRCDYDDKDSLKSYLEVVRNQVGALTQQNFKQQIVFRDKIGVEEVQINSTLGAAIYDAYSHSQHHFVTIGDIIKSERKHKASPSMA